MTFHVLDEKYTIVADDTLDVGITMFFLQHLAVLLILVLQI